MSYLPAHLHRLSRRFFYCPHKQQLINLNATDGIRTRIFHVNYHELSINLMIN